MGLTLQPDRADPRHRQPRQLSGGPFSGLHLRDRDRRCVAHNAGILDAIREANRRLQFPGNGTDAVVGPELMMRQHDEGDQVVLAVHGDLSQASATLTVRPILTKHLLDAGR
jgi:hypothetical protein